MVKYKTFGPDGRKVSEIGIGTYYDPAWIAWSRLHWLRGRREKVKAIRAGLENGCNMIDTAEIYGSEPLVREAIKGHDREQLFISTKILPFHIGSFMKSLESSLDRLGTKYVDLYLIHWRTGEGRIRQAMSAMEEAHESGLIKMIGVSNFDLGQTQFARQCLKKNTISAVQLEYNIFNRRAEKDILPYCEKENIAFMAYYPLAHGKLVGNEALGRIARDAGVTPAQLALKWLLRKQAVFPIPRASREQHVVENIRASDLEVDEKMLDKVDTEI
ncbi:MAG: aldo/keto reductase [Nitrososphaerota archaeon]|jgi:diketogulonate reductase-like aldo/keto reductase|nr:aldo/keto reductase [Nitrososphaerota archaeon]MDG6927872.1 aldo/keto reductase [Nitrososphaerota archaeon]MDG6931017.1 aldo/keto reductase [Nitrososphaerota archaeon]MDG6932123.1 aldo/keto reductase [Nitrososphaerota archaeon]MDG6936678.1 aldo/keto reductase [Nitrososphaerota archaeon]